MNEGLHERLGVAAARPATGEEDFAFVPATKAQARARIALTGVSGSGKTYTALKVSSVLGASTGVIDTERGSAAKYSHLFPFQHLPFGEPYEPRRLVRALAVAARQRLEVVVLDSLSHFWRGRGGMLDQADAAGRRNYGGNSFAGWKDAAPQERELIDAILAYPGHVIVTMRSKSEYVVEDGGGRKSVRKVGMRPVQREGIEYEFDLVGDLDLENTLTVTKSRCPDLHNEILHKPGIEIAERMLAWLRDGTPAATATDLRQAADADGVTKQMLRDLYSEAAALGILGAAVLDGDNRTVKLGDYLTTRALAAPEATA